MDSSAVATSVPGVDAYDAEMQKLLSINPQEGVGKRHHTVPAFYLRYFADGDRLNVARAPEDPKAPVLLIPRANLNDLAHRDFYTAIVDTPAGERALDGGLEHILSYLEGRAAKVLGRLRSPLLAARWVPDDEFHDVIQFVSFQIVRGVRPRREQELLADYVMRMTAEGTVVDGKRMTIDELSRIRVVPHQNHHLKNLGAAAEAIFEHLKQRPLSILEIDEPLFHTGMSRFSSSAPGRTRPTCQSASCRIARESVAIGRHARPAQSTRATSCTSKPPGPTAWRSRTKS